MNNQPITLRKIAAFVMLSSLLATLILSSVHTQAQAVVKTLVIGVISGVNSPTAHGVGLAVSRFNDRGNTVTPDGTAYKLSVTAQDANTAQEIATALNTLKAANAAVIFGPDRDDLAQASANTLQGIGLPLFTAATTTTIATGGNVFRTRADDTRMMSVLAQYLVNDLAKSKIAVFQGDPATAQRVTLFTTSMSQLGKAPATTVLQVAGGALSDSAKVLLGSQPDAVIAFGANDQAAQMLRELRGQGYNGLYVYPNAQDRPFVDALPVDLRLGIVGVTNWTYSLPTGVSGEFVRDYVALFGEVPTAESAAAYDAAGAAIIAIARNGLQPDAIQRGLLGLPRVESIEGHYNPNLGNNILSADVTVFTTGAYGAPVVSARFDETGRLAATGSTLPTLVPPASPIPPTSALPTQPPPPTQPQGVTITPKNSSLNVRRGPGTNYEVIGQLRKTDSAPVIGISPDGAWLSINFAGQQGWVVANLTDILGNLSTVPIIAPPPSPTPPPSPSAQPFPDLVMLSAVINPPQPKSGQPFTVSVVIRNQGLADAGHFAVAASFLPGNVYNAAIVPSLPAGATTTINLTATVTGPGTYTVAIVVDLNKEVNEGPNRRDNNFPFQYTVVP